MSSAPLPPIPPLIGVSACRKVTEMATAHSVGDKYVAAVIDGAGGLPVLIPALGRALPVDTLIDRLDGVFLTGSPSNLDPALYGGPPRPPGDPADCDRDATTLPLIRACLEQGVPLLAVCRGMQEMNVALGGTLFGRLHEVAGRRDHRSDKTLSYEGRYGPRHAVRLRPGGKLQAILGEVEEIEVNSLHGQGIDRLAPRLEVEATAPDGTIEAVSVPSAKTFALAVQWHPEWRVAEIAQHRLLFAAFGAACRQRLNARAAHERPRDMA
ncbi:MAG TPA: gamma-glutamyl-gamma-aminobutyrate hydrolase family protein [Geminicoccaceae bacterium]|nr:gamma-glutamyl-gamma-aminobutyrate hydrolase family protein [Geminicoccaceae bacterium]